MKRKDTAEQTRKGTKMKKNAQYEIDHINETIILTKKFRKEASLMGTPAYKELMKIKREHPTYKLEERVIAKKENKETYSDLTIDEMKKFIGYIHGDDKETAQKRLDELKGLEEFYDEFRKPAKYGSIKKWFLGYYKKQYTMTEDEEAA